MDKFKSMAIEGYIKNKFPQYFQDGAFSVDLNTGEASCRISATLAGEAAPLSIDVKKYEIIDRGSLYFIKVLEVSSDRAWLSAMLNDHLRGKLIPIPSMAAAALA